MAVVGQGYVVVRTADPDAWDSLLTETAGVMAAGTAANGAKLYRVDQRIFRFCVEPGDEELLAASGFLVENGTLDELAERISAAGRTVEWADQGEAAARSALRLFRTSDPADNPLEFYEGDAVAETPFVSPLGIKRFVTGEQGLGHSVFGAPDFQQSVDFYCDVVGLKQSDMPAFELFGPEGPTTHAAFLHGKGGRHHCVALIEGPVTPNRCVHLMLEMETLEEVGKAYDRAQAAGYRIAATLGKHSNDNVTSFYVTTPSGFDLEIGFDGLVVDWSDWTVTRHNQVSIWGHSWAWQEEMKKQGSEAAQ